MKANFSTWAVILAAATTLPSYAAESSKPLVIESQGSFFVGGETKTSKELNANANGPGAGDAGDVTINQMYVQYQTPVNGNQHRPVVMVHGCCLSSKTWETTPDGRMGWNEYFVRKNRSVYLADQSSRARSGFDATKITAVKTGKVPPSELPNIFMASHQTSWVLFRFGPTFNSAFPDEQFPVQAADELYKQMIPDLNGFLPTPNPTWTNMAALAVQLKGAVLIGHSESGFFPEQAALIDPAGVKGIVSIEMACETKLNPQQLSTLSKIPILIMFGDHLGDIPGRFGTIWTMNFDTCNTFVQQVTAAGGDAQMMYLPKMGIKGNSHMLMQDKNNLQLADLILGWIDERVEGKKGGHPK
jgi:pimeloyl-ACP methyl ester carboxylesterase